MSQQTRREVIGKLRGRYARAGLEHKTKIINQVVELFGYHRKAVIRALRQKERSSPSAARVIRRPRLYDPERLLQPLKRIWLAANQPCGKLLVAALPMWVPAYEVFYHSDNGPVASKVLLPKTHL